VWNSLTLGALNANSTGWAGYNLREPIFLNAGVIAGEKIRFRLRSSTAAGMDIVRAYVGQSASTTGDGRYQFATTPTQLLFGGVSGATVATNSTVTTDDTVFVQDGTKYILLSVDYNSVGTSAIRSLNDTTKSTTFFKLAGNASDVAPTGYSGGGLATQVIDLGEIFA
jgi:hypothetical protein